MSSTYAFLDGPLPIAFAHRGGADGGVENVASLFEDVARLGYRYIETDVRTTADGVAVVFHDADLRRLTGDRARIRDLAFAQVRRVALRNGEQIEPLASVLDAFPELRFNIDLKDWGSVRSVPDVLARTGAYDRVCVASFSERRVRQARRALGRRVCTSLGVGGVALLLLHRLTGTPRGRRAYGAAAAQVPWRLIAGRQLPAAFVELAHREGLAVHVWTLDDSASINAALDLGVDGIMTDRPVLLKEELLRRGLWTG